jgi:hypothetical protein
MKEEEDEDEEPVYRNLSNTHALVDSSETRRNCGGKRFTSFAWRTSQTV